MKKTYFNLRRKLISAAAMLLVATILMASSTYAWLVLSTNPEVTGISTQVGANGSLEMALLNAQSWLELELLDMGDIDESTLGDSGYSGNNLTWGNLVNLANDYGLEKIVLNPARLNIKKDGNQEDAGYLVAASLLKAPIYGEDGRVVGLNDSGVVNKVYADGAFSEDGYGVRAIGTAADMSIFQRGMNSASNTMSTSRAAARTQASTTLSETGGGLANIIVNKYINSVNDFTVDDVKQIRELAVGMQAALEEIEQGLRAGFAGYITTEKVLTATKEKTIEDVYNDALAEINNPEVSLSTLLTKYPKITDLITGMSEYISTLNADSTAVQKVITFCDRKITANEGATWENINSAISGLVKVDNMTVAGKTVAELEDLMKQGTDAVVAAVMAGISEEGGLYINVPSGSGVLSNIADFAEDYEATVKVSLSVSGLTLDNTPVVMRTDSSVSPAYLTKGTKELKNGKVAEADGSLSITDYFGYAIDLAFRTNAEKANLLLQTTPEQRIYDASKNTKTQGGGSFMSFQSSANLSATKMVKLMGGIRVVFMDGENHVMAIAALDTTLGKNVYTGLKGEERKDANGDIVVTDTTKRDVYKLYYNEESGTITREAYEKLSDTKKYLYEGVEGEEKKDENGEVMVEELKIPVYESYYLNKNPESKNAIYQKSDIITREAYEKLLENSNVEFSDGQVSAKLYIYSFEMTLSTADHSKDDDYVEGKEYPTGGITLLERQDDGVIMALEQDVATKLTALVYLDGSVVNNSMVEASAAQSMSGTLNLQFSTDVALVPMEINDLMKETETTTTETSDPSGETQTTN